MLGSLLVLVSNIVLGGLGFSLDLMLVIWLCRQVSDLCWTCCPTLCWRCRIFGGLDDTPLVVFRDVGSSLDFMLRPLTVLGGVGFLLDLISSTVLGGVGSSLDVVIVY